ncbi:hypothetical protein J5N97_023568 [Dioscorea zingiberensis]|uniref:C2H2-type domain-containing protein n=1 Tax=Dioscorea zingiberensis TaxID=325984 RepID=A0A9D5C534_9LILI|nr:hypothetical protein J5N97_023568 [Dioscorea zingiberensis]
METMEEARGSSMSSNSNNNEALLPIVKGKRTKRHRGTPPATAASSTSSSGLSGATTEEEEDMANCLILLARGGITPKAPEDSGVVKQEKFTSRKLAETATTTTDGKAGFYVYECKTCNKCFPSFQALGGHRASHKKPKLAAPAITADEKKPPANDEDNSNNNLQISMNSFYKPVVATSRPRVHECSICGSEFSSGQALGGHMRRHRPLDVPEQPEIKRERTGLLSLDLNLPAPSEDSPSSINPFPLAFSVSALVDCHY